MVSVFFGVVNFRTPPFLFEIFLNHTYLLLWIKLLRKMKLGGRSLTKSISRLLSAKAKGVVHSLSHGFCGFGGRDHLFVTAYHYQFQLKT